MYLLNIHVRAATDTCIVRHAVSGSVKLHECSAQFANLRNFEIAVHKLEIAVHKLEIANQFQNWNPISKLRRTFAHS